MRNSNGLETEVKIRIPNVASAESRLRAAGFSVSVPRRFESNTVYDTPDQKLKNSETLLRLRQSGCDAVITWKGPSIPGPHKSRPELETSVGSLETLAEILANLEFTPIFRYEKYRTEYRQNYENLNDAPAQTNMETEPRPEGVQRKALRAIFKGADSDGAATVKEQTPEHLGSVPGSTPQYGANSSDSDGTATVTERSQPGSSGLITLDETPIGDFLELEGPPDWIDQTAKLLGFEASAYVLTSYGRLYLEDCAKRGVPPGNMVFSEPR